MEKASTREKGFTLIAALLLTLLLSAMAVGLIFLVTNEGHASSDLIKAKSLLDELRGMAT